MTKYLTRLKETSINHVCEKFEKTLRIKFAVDFGFSNELFSKKQKPDNAGNQQNDSELKIIQC